MESYELALDAEFLERLRRFVRGRVRSQADADDVLQDVLVKLLRKGGSVPPTSVRAWLFTVTRNEIHDRWRAERRAGAALTHEPPRAEEDTEAIDYLSTCMRPMLTMLPEEQRELLERVDVRGESQAEIARAEGLSLSTLKSRVQRARARLLDVLEGCCEVERDRLGRPIDVRRRPDRPSPCDSGE